MIVFSRARWRTIWLRRVTCRRSARVALVRHPDLRQEAAGVEPRQHGRVDHVGLDACLGDQPHLARVGDHHPADMRVGSPRRPPWHCRSPRSPHGRRASVAARMPPRWSRVIPIRPSRTILPSSSITASANTRWMSNPTIRIGSASSCCRDLTGAGGQHGNYGSALAAHPGEPQGRPDNGSGSQPMVQGSACPHLRAPGAPCPGWSHHSADPGGSAGRETSQPSCVPPSVGETPDGTLSGQSRC